MEDAASGLFQEWKHGNQLNKRILVKHLDEKLKFYFKCVSVSMSNLVSN